jgi:hypothetical protein
MEGKDCEDCETGIECRYCSVIQEALGMVRVVTFQSYKCIFFTLVVLSSAFCVRQVVIGPSD